MGVEKVGPKIAPEQSSLLLSAVKHGHQAFVHQRRVRVLAETLAAQIPPAASVLDIGCGDGTIASLITQLRPDISVRGVEVMARPGCRIDCQPFDGSTLPFPDNCFDLCMLVDVLHHTTDVSVLLREAARVGRTNVLLKDHLSENALDHATLRFMDWVGNRPHGVALTYNYQSRAQWDAHFAACALEVATFSTDVRLYPPPFSAVVGRELHFVALLHKIQTH
jgi:ubiquinone/menaquinone biosynthesis C-methylase UbiE